MIPANSRNTLTDVVQVTDPISGQLTQPEFVDLRSRVTSTGVDDRFVVVSSAMNWANIALSQLGDARHWWVIADLTGVVDPFNELNPGTVVRVPSVSRLLFSILAPSE